MNVFKKAHLSFNVVYLFHLCCTVRRFVTFFYDKQRFLYLFFEHFYILGSCNCTESMCCFLLEFKRGISFQSNIPVEEDLVHNDFKREMLFYRQAQTAVLEGLQRYRTVSIPIIQLVFLYIRSGYFFRHIPTSFRFNFKWARYFFALLYIVADPDSNVLIL